MTYCREEHYRIEKELADRLKCATADERKKLYTEIYDELFRRVPHHPMLVRKVSREQRQRYIQQQLQLLNRFLADSLTFLEVGPGDCKLSFAVAEIVQCVIAVDVSNVITKAEHVPDNFLLLMSDGVNIPVSENSVDVAFSDQLVEHLHPDDARQHFGNVHQALRPGGLYICITPSRLSGPHDVSKFYESRAAGMHLKEYTFKELRKDLSIVGFSRFRCVVGSRGYFLELPVWAVERFEAIISFFPKVIARLPVIRTFLAVRLIAFK